jgi:hypothetical protein
VIHKALAWAGLSPKKRKQSRPNLVNILERICPSGQKENLGGVAQLTKASYSFLIWSIPPGAFFLWGASFHCM